jgi:hypothetical protein
VPGEHTYDYAIIRVVPRVDRGEQMNVGIILSCVDSDFLDIRIALDETRLRALDLTADLESVQAGLTTLKAVCAGGPEGGPVGELPPRARFRWMVSPRSTVVQTSPVHTGRTDNPQAALQHLFETMVL